MEAGKETEVEEDGMLLEVEEEIVRELREEERERTALLIREEETLRGRG